LRSRCLCYSCLHSRLHTRRCSGWHVNCCDAQPGRPSFRPRVLPRM
jgi:hypothetical protein